MWQHSLHSPDKSFRNWEGEPWADPGVVPSLVQELALLQLRSLLVAGFQDSSELGAVGVEVASSVELLHEDAEERP